MIKRNTIVTKERFIDWLSQHEIAFDDFCTYFLDLYPKLCNTSITTEGIVSWLLDHDELSRDFIIAFTDMTPNAVEELDDIDVYDKVNELFGL